ncbi:hypothetical protein [Streptomyces sp. NPDC046909]|uniref:hypothetical protein n=1 Tax=Streptomyces sp. NPDC046909 TaxID=3155617 RepID=UPI003410AA45
MKAGFAVGAGVLLASVLVLGWAQNRPSSTALDLVSMLAQSVMVGAVWIGYAVYVKRATRPGLVVWLRRFRPDQGDRIRFHRALGTACFGFASAVTLQDPSFNTSLVSAGYRVWFLAPVLCVLWVVGLFALALLMYAAGTMNEGLFVFGILFWTALFVWGATELLRRRGVLSRQLSPEQTAVHLDAVRRGERRVGEGVEVIKVMESAGSERWKGAVAQALDRADLAVVDVSDVTPQIEWELREVFRRLWPKRILLVAQDDKARADVLSAQLRAMGVRDATVPWVQESLLPYPAAQAAWPKTNAQYADLVRRLRRAVAERVGQ